MRFVGALRGEIIRTVIPKKTTVTAHPDDVDRCHCGQVGKVAQGLKYWNKIWRHPVWVGDETSD